MNRSTAKDIRLPEVGARRMEIPTFGTDIPPVLWPCRVEYVNREHGFYTVRFDRLNYLESYHPGIRQEYYCYRKRILHGNQQSKDRQDKNQGNQNQTMAHSGQVTVSAFRRENAPNYSQENYPQSWEAVCP